MNHQCPAYAPASLPYTKSTGNGLVKGIRSRGDIDYARELVSILPTEAERSAWSIYGWCERPKADLFVGQTSQAGSFWNLITDFQTYDFILSPGGMAVPEDLSPSLLKVVLIPEGFMVSNVTGIRVHIVRRLDGKGYEIRKRMVLRTCTFHWPTVDFSQLVIILYDPGSSYTLTILRFSPTRQTPASKL